MEEYYIKYYDSINKGYNILPSRTHCTSYGFKGKKHTEEYKNYMRSQQVKPIAQYDLNASKVCDVLKGRRNHHKNFKFKYI